VRPVDVVGELAPVVEPVIQIVIAMLGHKLQAHRYHQSLLNWIDHPGLMVNTLIWKTFCFP
jgi:hypothetical protein